MRSLHRGCDQASRFTSSETRREMSAVSDLSPVRARIAANPAIVSAGSSSVFRAPPAADTRSIAAWARAVASAWVSDEALAKHGERFQILDNHCVVRLFEDHRHSCSPCECATATSSSGRIIASDRTERLLDLAPGAASASGDRVE